MKAWRSKLLIDIYLGAQLIVDPEDFRNRICGKIIVKIRRLALDSVGELNRSIRQGPSSIGTEADLVELFDGLGVEEIQMNLAMIKLVIENLF